MGRTKGSKNKKKQIVEKRSASKSSSKPPKAVAKVAPKAPKPAELVKSRKRIPASKKVIEKDLPDKKPLKKVKPTKLEMDSAEVSKLLSAKMLKFDEPTCYVCLKTIKCPWEEASVDKANNVYRHHRCSTELIRRWYLTMGLVYEPKTVYQKKEKDLITDEDLKDKDEYED